MNIRSFVFQSVIFPACLRALYLVGAPSAALPTNKSWHTFLSQKFWKELSLAPPAVRSPPFFPPPVPDKAPQKQRKKSFNNRVVELTPTAGRMTRGRDAWELFFFFLPAPSRTCTTRPFSARNVALSMTTSATPRGMHMAQVSSQTITGAERNNNSQLLPGNLSPKFNPLAPTSHIVFIR